MRSAAKTRTRTLAVLTAIVAALALPPAAPSQGQRRVSSSLLLLIDASGSMGDAIGAGNAEVKIAAAKRAATAALGRAAGGGSVEVAVLAFSGDCQNPVPRYQDFTRDVGRLTRFIASLQPGGGTGPAPNCDPDRRGLPPCRRRQPALRCLHGVRRHAERDRHAGKVRLRYAGNASESRLPAARRGGTKAGGAAAGNAETGRQGRTVQHDRRRQDQASSGRRSPCGGLCRRCNDAHRSSAESSVEIRDRVE